MRGGAWPAGHRVAWTPALDRALVQKGKAVVIGEDSHTTPQSLPRPTASQPSASKKSSKLRVRDEFYSARALSRNQQDDLAIARYREIAETMGVTESTLKTRLHRARSKLAKNAQQMFSSFPTFHCRPPV